MLAGTGEILITLARMALKVCVTTAEVIVGSEEAVRLVRQLPDHFLGQLDKM